MGQLTQTRVPTQHTSTMRPSVQRPLLQRASITPIHVPTLQRCSNGVECSECHQKRLEREGALQRAAVNSVPANGVPPIVHDVLNSSGQPLDAGTRAFMEPRFGHDFSLVRVHTDARAAESARSVNALAYTVGRNVVFGTGQYTPGTSEGRRLMAHELTHVVQQPQSTEGRGPIQIGLPQSLYEHEADQVAQVVSSEYSSSSKSLVPTLSISSGPISLQRLGANPGCTGAEAKTIHQAIHNASGWLNKAITQLKTTPLSPKVSASLTRNFGSTYGVGSNRQLILDRLHAVHHEINAIPFSCAGTADPTCAANHCGVTPVTGGHAATICRNVTLTAGTKWQFQAGCVLHEAFHAAFSRFTVDEYSGWHGFSGSTATFPGTGTDPLLNADSYTTLVIDLS